MGEDLKRMNKPDFKFRLCLDGCCAYLFSGTVLEVAFIWSDKNKAYEVRFRSKLNEAKWTRNPAFVNYFSELLTLIEAYKKEADALDKSRQALELIINKNEKAHHLR